MSKQRRDTSANEQKLWRYVTRNVKPYHASRQNLETPQSPLIQAAATPLPSPPPTYDTRSKKPQIISPISVGLTPNIDRRTSTKFKRGKLPLDGQIDLHGLTLHQAHARFTSFVRSAIDRQARCILVITGKGRGSDQIGKIRRELPHWINDPTLRTHVLAVTEAQHRDGGSGAFYILLKRMRHGGAG